MIRLVMLRLSRIRPLIYSHGFSFVIGILLSSFLSVADGCARVAAPVQTRRAAVYFSPDGGATEALVREIELARRQILVQAYGFTSAPILKALVAAQQRGVAVQAVLDKSNETARYTGATFLANAGVPVLIDARHAIAHNKIMIIDDATLVTGSFNFTKAAEEKNAENLLILRDDPELVQLYTQNFHAHANHAVPYQREAGASAPAERQRQERRAVSAAAPQRERATVATASGKIRGNLKSKVYHLPGCPGYERVNPDLILSFKTESAAQRAGYRKAENCQRAVAY